MGNKYIKFIFICFFLTGLGFNAPIVITEIQGLTFPTRLTGTYQVVTVRNNEPTAARFTATGDPDSKVAFHVVEGSILLSIGGSLDPTRQMTVNSFSTKGSGKFDKNGNITDLAVGATLIINANNIAGIYSGAATFRLVYN